MIIVYESVYQFEELSTKEVSKVGLEELWLMNVFIRVDKKLKYSEEENYFESFNNIESQFSIADIQYLIDSLPDGYKWCSIYMLSKDISIKKLPVC
jgi:hypothetical protein